MNTNEVARVAALLGEPARTAMLIALMDGRYLTARELAQAGHVLPQTASKHLSQMVEAGLLTVYCRGKYRYHGIASPQVAQVIEGIMQLAAVSRDSSKVRIAHGPKDADMRRARTCYDHIAGCLGVAIADRLSQLNAIELSRETSLTKEHLNPFLLGMSIDSEALKEVTTCKPCLDWSERRYHIAGQLGRMLCKHALASGWLLQRQDSRALDISAIGAKRLSQWLGSDLWRQVNDAALS
jgi:DNA-binding transcriptional ArsR family regulator